MPTEKQIQQRAEEIQSKLHAKHDKGKHSYQAIVNSFLMIKLAELELKIEELESRPVNLNLT